MQVSELQENPLATADRFRFMELSDVDQLVALGARFFKESEFTDFTEFNPENFTLWLKVVCEDPNSEFIVFETGGQIEGFMSVVFDTGYTKDPLALGNLFYVTPEYRRSPVGRYLLQMAEAVAKARGCCAIYMGSMAGIDGVSKSLPNMFRKQGFEDLYWARKVLK